MSKKSALIFLVSTITLVLIWWTYPKVSSQPLVSMTDNTPNGTVVAVTPTTEKPENSLGTKKIDLEAGQFFMIGHWSGTPYASTTELIQQYKIGGVVIMSAPEDPEEISTWTEAWQAVSTNTLLIAIDQEGGPVSRLKGEGFTTTAQSEIFDEETAYAVGLARGNELKKLGINANFSPVLDSATNQDSFMYSRVFKKRADSARLAQAMIEGLSTAGVIGVVKHFPGHDDTTEDSHTTLPSVNIAKGELASFISPFSDLITASPPSALMTAHVAFPLLDPLPASLSKFWLTEVLRTDLRFNGVIITDDMSMDAIDAQLNPSEAALKSILAGADMVLFAAEPNLVKGAVELIAEALTSGQLTKERYLSSLVRLQSLHHE